MEQAALSFCSWMLSIAMMDECLWIPWPVGVLPYVILAQGKAGLQMAFRFVLNNAPAATSRRTKPKGMKHAGACRIKQRHHGCAQTSASLRRFDCRGHLGWAGAV